MPILRIGVHRVTYRATCARGVHAGEERDVGDAGALHDPDLSPDPAATRQPRPRDGRGPRRRRGTWQAIGIPLLIEQVVEDLAKVRCIETAAGGPEVFAAVEGKASLPCARVRLDVPGDRVRVCPRNRAKPAWVGGSEDIRVAYGITRDLPDGKTSSKRARLDRLVLTKRALRTGIIGSEGKHEPPPVRESVCVDRASVGIKNDDLSRAENSADRRQAGRFAGSPILHVS